VPEFDNVRDPGAPRRPHGDKLEEALPDGEAPALEDDDEERSGLLADAAGDRLGAAADAPAMEDPAE
jgi:hypothetical protein